MKSNLLLSIIACFLLSCNQYHYLTVSGLNVLKNEKNELIYDSDTISVHYHFTEGPGRLAVTIFNRTDQPVEINWKKSSFIVNDTAISYYDAKAVFTGRVENNRIPESLRINGREVNGTIVMDEPVQFIPPNSSVLKKIVSLAAVQPAISWPVEITEKKTFHVETGEAVTYKQAQFGKEESPASFRSYLTFKIGKGNEAKDFTLDHRFYISEAWKSQSGPEYFTTELSKRGDIFYFEQ